MIKSTDELLWLGLLIGVVWWLVSNVIALFYWVTHKIKNRRMCDKKNVDAGALIAHAKKDKTPNVHLFLGDLLPPMGATVQIYLASLDEWLDHEVVGYCVWHAHNTNDCFRVGIRVKDANGITNVRLLQDIKWVKS